jgi:hypothetical protein
MKNIKKVLLFSILLTFIGCSQNAYVRTIESGYSKSKEDKTIYIKEDETDTYTKKKSKYTVYENQHFLVLKTNKETNEQVLYLALKYRGSDWIYMSALDLISGSTYHIDFMSRKLSTTLWRDKSNLVDSVEEYIAIALTPEEIVAIKAMVNTGHGEIKYYSEVKEKTATTTLTETEIENMKDILKLYSGKVTISN